MSKARIFMICLSAAMAAGVVGCGDVSDAELDDAALENGLVVSPGQTAQGKYCNSCIGTCKVGPGGRARDIDLGHAMTPSQCADAAEKLCGDSLVGWSCRM
jgi:hypothetical protein